MIIKYTCIAILYTFLNKLGNFFYKMGNKIHLIKYNYRIEEYYILYTLVPLNKRGDKYYENII